MKWWYSQFNAQYMHARMISWKVLHMSRAGCVYVCVDDLIFSTLWDKLFQWSTVIQSTDHIIPSYQNCSSVNWNYSVNINMGTCTYLWAIYCSYQKGFFKASVLIWSQKSTLCWIYLVSNWFGLISYIIFPWFQAWRPSEALIMYLVFITIIVHDIFDTWSTNAFNSYMTS